MCGRYSLFSNATDLWEQIAASFPLSRIPTLNPETIDTILKTPGRRKYNIVPTSYEPILRLRQETVVLETAHWWLLPSWAAAQAVWRRSKTGEKSFSWKDQPKSHFNSRWDTITASDNRPWNELLASKRCLIPADGFIEWPDDALRPKNQEKIPHYFGLEDRKPFFFAGIYDESVDDEGKLFVSFNIITVEPNTMLRQLPHHRMPAILTEGAVGEWLEPMTAVKAAELLRPLSEERMLSYPLSTRVNSAANESPFVLEPRNEQEADPTLL